MNNRWLILRTAFLVLLVTRIPVFIPSSDVAAQIKYSSATAEANVQVPAEHIIIDRDISVAAYFQYIDSLIVQYDSLTSYKLTEHMLVRANPWIIDTLANTDYYRMAERDSFVYDQRKMVVLRAKDSLTIPDLESAMKISEIFQRTHINVPEYKLRIYEDSTLLFTFSVRVGRNEKKYLAMGNRITDLRTRPGQGVIVRHVRNPSFYNPVNGKQFFYTKRDDRKTTLMPQIPWIETEINGVRNGQMIHPTTNPETLGKAYSNGCIGTREADAWILYYHAPLGTRIHIRYNLESVDENGNSIMFEDVYDYN